MKRAVVTGATGFVGSKLVKELADSGYYVYAVIRNKKSDAEKVNGENVRIVYCELENISCLAEQIESGIDCFFHLAWSGSAGDSRADYEVQLNNVRYACKAVETASKLKCRRFLFAGSIMEYEALSCLSGEGRALGLGYIYSVAKLTADYMSKVKASNLNMEYINLLISNIYGPEEISSRFVNTTIKKFLRNERMQFTSGEQWYDFIYITDAVKAMRIVAESGKGNSEYYIGNSNVLKLKEFIIKMRDILAPSCQVYLGEIPYEGISPDYNKINTRKIYDEFNFQPEVSFEKGILLTKEWMKKYEQI